MSTVGGYLEYRGGCSVPWGNIMINVGDILSTVGAGENYQESESSVEYPLPMICTRKIYF